MKIFDAHGDLFAHFTYKQQSGETNVFKNYHLDNFEKGEVNFGVFNVWIDNESSSNKQRAKEVLSFGMKEVLESNDIKMIYNFDEFDLESKTIQFILGLEGIDYLDNAEELYMMYQLGTRLISLTWNNNNNFATSIASEVDNGLSEEGIKAVKIMDELGIVIDISHLSDKSAREILNISKNPIIASHSNARAICNHGRNLPDDIIIAIAKSGGVVGINSFFKFVSTKSSEWNVENLITHIDYIKDLVGIDYIALGFDFLDYLDEVSDDNINPIYIEGLKNHSDAQGIVKALINRGYSEEEVEKICYKNIFRVLEQVL